MQVPSWRELQREFAARPPPGAFGGLNSRLQRPLAAAVCAHVADLRAAPRASKLDMLRHLLAPSCDVVAQVAAQCAAVPADNGARQDGAVVCAVTTFPLLFGGSSVLVFRVCGKPISGCRSGEVRRRAR